MLSEAKHPATSIDYRYGLASKAIKICHAQLTAELVEVAGFFASLRMTLCDY
jgi:hypothetical protein